MTKRIQFFFDENIFCASSSSSFVRVTCGRIHHSDDKIAFFSDKNRMPFVCSAKCNYEFATKFDWQNISQNIKVFHGGNLCCDSIENDRNPVAAIQLGTLRILCAKSKCEGAASRIDVKVSTQLTLDAECARINL